MKYVDEKDIREHVSAQRFILFTRSVKACASSQMLRERSKVGDVAS